jgi:hypothetical protein
MLFSKQNSRISRVSCEPKPSQICTRDFPFACSLVSESNIRFSHSRLIFESVYPDSLHAYCHPGVWKVVQLLRWVVAGQIIIGLRYLSSALIHSIAVTVVRLTRAPLQSRLLSLPTRTLTEPGIDSITPVSSILYTFSVRIAGSPKTFPDHLKPFFGLPTYVFLMAIPFDCFHPSHDELWVTLFESHWPVSTRRL